jgi:hypothetical protein
LREWRPDPVRRNILDTLERIIEDRKDLTLAAHRIARFWWQPRKYVWWRTGVPHVQDGVRLGFRMYYDKRNVVVPAAWLLARLGTDGNVASRLRDADPRSHVLATPRWLERVAAGVLRCSLQWLTDDERAAVRARQDAIYTLRQERQSRRTPPEWRLGEMHVKARGRGAVLRLSGEWAYAWDQHWPSRAEIIKGATAERKTLEERRKHRDWQAAQERALAFAPDAPDTLGWRGWRWDGHVLVSPVQGTPWHEATLRAEHWSDSAAVRGQAGIHARRMPCDWLGVDPKALPEIGSCEVHGNR